MNNNNNLKIPQKIRATAKDLKKTFYTANNN